MDQEYAKLYDEIKKEKEEISSRTNQQIQTLKNELIEVNIKLDHEAKHNTALRCQVSQSAENIAELEAKIHILTEEKQVLLKNHEFEIKKLNREKASANRCVSQE